MAVDEEPIKDDVERPVPQAWRPVLRQVVEAIRAGDARLASGIPGVGEVDVETAVQISEYVEDYGEGLVALPEETWETSIALWLGSCWEVLVDLWTEPGVRSDLVLHVQVFEQDPGYRFEVGLVYVP